MMMSRIRVVFATQIPKITMITHITMTRFIITLIAIT